MKFTEKIVARGHENIRATHRTTLEITKERELTPRGDCIVGVSADKSISELNEEIKAYLRRGYPAKITLELPDHSLEETLIGYGHSGMGFNHKTDIVIRKSRFICDRTLLIRANKAAADLSRDFVEMLKDRKTEIIFVIEIQL